MTGVDITVQHVLPLAYWDHEASQQKFVQHEYVEKAGRVFVKISLSEI